MRFHEHTFQQFLKVKNIPLTDISGIELTEKYCECGCGNKVKVSKNSEQKYWSTHCPIVKGYAENNQYRNSMRSPEFKNKRKPTGLPINDTQVKVIKLLGQGKTYAEIALEVNVRIDTVTNYLANARKKLNCKTNFGLVNLLGAA
jgi:DNA-binding CsgD family transcriptional regulator